MSMPLDRATPLPPGVDHHEVVQRQARQPPGRGRASPVLEVQRRELERRPRRGGWRHLGRRRQRDNIRTAAPPSPGMVGSPSVVARLMGLDALPHAVAEEEDGQCPLTQLPTVPVVPLPVSFNPAAGLLPRTRRRPPVAALQPAFSCGRASSHPAALPAVFSHGASFPPCNFPFWLCPS
ncbi:uncharacterized protein LOC119331517 [Triticum dicoccoides]|uniref:uncharacterized protein LOC119331517 n=1 Tax=Triticum dicoccoides TaxID=85692 RepID=UPI001890C8A4|nr:uncharacterized protein LOC119331517 [Triticum dicoccoides]